MSYRFLDDINLDINRLEDSDYQFPFVTEFSFSNGIAVDFYNLARYRHLDIGTSVSQWVTKLCDLQQGTIPQAPRSAFISKLHRTIKLANKKRGQMKNDYLMETFPIPQQTMKERESNVTTEPKEVPTGVSGQLKERRQKVRVLQQQVIGLKRKHDRSSLSSASMNEKRMRMEMDLKELQKGEKRWKRKSKVADAKLGLAKNKGDIYFNKYMSERKQTTRMKKRIGSDEAKIARLEKQVASSEVVDLQDEVIKLRVEVKENETSNHYLQSLLHDNSELELYDAQKRTAMKCMMDLTDMKVPVDKVGRVIQTVAKICGKIPNALPSTTTVNRAVDSKATITQAHLAAILPDEQDMTLYTDETRKYGRCAETYIVTDKNQDSYLLGLREMYNKSGQCTLDTMREVLSDIAERCHDDEKKEKYDVGYKILANIKDTMSDRASTETNFNKLLQKYRESILPEVVDGWQEMQQEDRELCSRMNNFFCGLHLLCGMADSCAETLKKFENESVDEPIGSAKHAELKRFHRSESGTIRLIRTACKTLAVGEDEKNGCSLDWKLYLKENKESNRIVRFKHNRFNLIFYLGHAVYFHHKDIGYFLDTVHGHSNPLLRAVSFDVKEPLYLAGLRALGMISKFISAPLWRILEEEGHILSMNAKYQDLVTFLDECTESVELTMEFMRGKRQPFADVETAKEDKVLEYLIEEDDSSDAHLCPMLQQLFTTISLLLKRMVTDHLPGGKYWSPTAAGIPETQSTKKHNKLPEFIFGQLDQLLRYRPNATVLTNESYLMYSHNKTSNWLDGLDTDVREKMLDDSRKKGRDVRAKFKSRLANIDKERLKQQKIKQKEREEKEQRRIQNAECLTQNVCYFGLWQNAQQIDEGLVPLKTATEQRKALTSQLKFRKTVLMQKHAQARIYNFSEKDETGKYKPYTVDQLKSNLLILIQDVMKTETQEQQNSAIPLLVGRRVEHAFKEQRYFGNVISVVPGFPSWYNVRYDNDNAIYAYNLKEDYEKGDLKIVIEGPDDSAT